MPLTETGAVSNRPQICVAPSYISLADLGESVSDSLRKLTLRSPGASGLRVRAFNHKIDYVSQVQSILNPEGFEIVQLVQTLQQNYWT